MRSLPITFQLVLIFLLVRQADAAIILTEVPTAVPDLSVSDTHWIDFDADGDFDLFIMGFPAGGTNEALSLLFRNDDGTLVDSEAGLLGLGDGSADWTDLDADGDLDLVLCGYNEDDVPYTRFYRNNSGEFVEEYLELLNVSGTVIWEDHDADGDFDLLISGDSNGGSGYSGIFLSDGQTIVSGEVYPDGLVEGEFAFADLDRDGRQDRAYAGRWMSDNPALNGVYSLDVERQLEDGSYSSRLSLPGIRGADLDFGDVDNDGDIDMISQGQDAMGNNLTRIHYQSAQGFTESLLASYWYGDAAFGDADNDGDLDLAYGGANSVGQISFSIYENQGGSFSFAQSVAALAFSSVAWGDYDGDGDLDLALSGANANGEPEFHLYRNDTFLLNNAPTTPSGLTVVASADEILFSWSPGSDLETAADGLSYNLRVGSTPGGIDVVNPHAGADGTRYLTGLGNASSANQFYLDTVSISNARLYWSVQSVDPSGATSAFSAEHSFLLPFSELHDTDELGGWSHGRSDWGDYDDDGRMECVVAGHYGLSGTVSSTRIYDPREGPAMTLSYLEDAVQWGDFDNDNDLDLVVTSNFDFEPIQLYENEGGDLSLVSNSGLPDREGGTVEWGDVDNDGDQDLLLEEFGLYRNDGDGFVAMAGIEPGVYGYASFGDFDRDGDLDILQGGCYDGVYEHRIQRNDGDAWTQVGPAIPANNQAAGAFVDYDGDGDFDVVVSAEELAPAIYRNDGGAFVHDALASNGLPTMNNAKILIWDLDHDGDADLVFSGSAASFEETVVMENQGGSFSKLAAGLPERDAYGAAGHFDDDNQLDLLLLGSGGMGNGTGVYRGNHGPNQTPQPPTGLGHGIIGDELLLYWSIGSDAETPNLQLTHNVRVGTTPGGSEILSAMAHPDGRRKIARPGNAGHPNVYRLKLSAISTPVLYWSVQTVDGSYVGSAFAPESTVELHATHASPTVAALRIESIAPNPVSSRAQIAFRTPTAAEATVSMFDLRGRRVRVLHRGWLPAGPHLLQWDGRDGAGQTVSSGVYFCRLESGGQSRTQKLSLRR